MIHFQIKLSLTYAIGVNCQCFLQMSRSIILELTVVGTVRLIKLLAWNLKLDS